MKARLPEGYGKQNRNQMLEKLTQMQENMAAKQAELAEKEYTASAGGSMVAARVNGAHKVLSVSVKPEVCDPEDTEMLGDLVAAAVNAAIEAASADYQSKMDAITGGMELSGMG